MADLDDETISNLTKTLKELGADKKGSSIEELEQKKENQQNIIDLQGILGDLLIDQEDRERSILSAKESILDLDTQIL